MLNYLEVINQNIKPGTRTSKIYLIHAVLVTNKALGIGRRLGLTAARLQFMEEAAMLHDIGVVKVEAPKMDCFGKLPYICHGVEGGKILRALALEPHALVAERHLGVGFTEAEIISRNLPLPHQDFLPISLEERIITYADLFFSKREETLWLESTTAELLQELAEYEGDQVLVFKKWQAEFESNQ